jgi:hypothetical protein
MMAEDFDRILDECIDRINGGDSVANCLSDYPAYSEKLKPLLRSMHDVQKACTFTPSADTKRAARQKLHAVLGKRQQKTPALSFFKAISRPAVWATVAVLVLAIVGSLVIQSVLNSSALVPSPEGNFAFLISDDPGDINDFKNLDVTILEVQLQPVGSKEWLEFTPEIETVDLTQLQGEQFKEIWRGHVPAGQYARLRIYLSEVKGELESTGQTIDLNVPGGIVHMLIPFEVTVDTVTMYTFDITVVGINDDGKYMLKLQINESGARQEPKLFG